jgi:hypothetical protein
MRQLVSVLAEGKASYFLADDDGHLTEFAIVNVGAVNVNGHSALSLANVGVAMVDNFGLGQPAVPSVRARALPPAFGSGRALPRAKRRRRSAPTRYDYAGLVGWVAENPGVTTTEVKAWLGVTTSTGTTFIERLRRLGLHGTRDNTHRHTAFRWYVVSGTKT